MEGNVTLETDAEIGELNQQIGRLSFELEETNRLLMIARGTHRMDSLVRTKGWDTARVIADEGMELAGKTVGIVGFGAACELAASRRHGLAAELESAALHWGLDVLVEVHDEAELARALKLKSRMIGWPPGGRSLASSRAR